MASWTGVAVGLLSAAITVLHYFWKYFCRSYPQFCALPGPFQYVGVSHHRIPGNVRFKMFYPSSKSLVKSKNLRPPRYFTDGDVAAKGLHHFITSSPLKVPLALFRALSSDNPSLKTHPVPCYQDAPLDDIAQLPVILVSHGMGGNFDIYTQLCCNLASLGLLVAMVEHTDGSASHCKLHNGTDLFYAYQHSRDQHGAYAKPSGADWTREHTIAFRGPQTDHRVQNMLDVMHFLAHTAEHDAQLARLCAAMDFAHVFVAGHSFGGITAVFTAKAMQKAQTEDSAYTLRGAIAFEPWFEPKVKLHFRNLCF